MNNTELKIVFHLLQDKHNAGKTFRQIAAETGTSVGSVHSTMEWRVIVLPDTLSWSGEPAAALLDKYLAPQRWDIYTTDTANPLISTGRMIPDPQGNIFVYRKFWKEQDTPLLIIYADLLATQDDRCREAAERIKPLI